MTLCQGLGLGRYIDLSPFLRFGVGSGLVERFASPTRVPMAEWRSRSVWAQASDFASRSAGAPSWKCRRSLIGTKAGVERTATPVARWCGAVPIGSDADHRSARSRQSAHRVLR